MKVLATINASFTFRTEELPPAVSCPDFCFNVTATACPGKYAVEAPGRPLPDL